jgi:uncharacterized repeat protein (TIGR03803 family)
MTTIRIFVHARLGAALIAMLFAGSALASGQTEFLAYSFPTATRSSMADGCSPQGNLVADSAGNLYGTTKDCGVGVGVVFELTRPVPPDTEWTETVLYTFATSTLDGSNPQEGVVFDAFGNLYGTTASGGTTGFGVVFELLPPATAGGPWTESILYNFQGGVTDGATPSGGVVFDSAGNLYGVTANGGSGEQEYDFDSTGIAYKLTPSPTPGAPWTETILHHFLARAGVVHPVGALVFDGKGNLYGASEGGTSIGHSLGAAAYKLASPVSGSGEWNQTLLYSFGGPDDGPQSGLTFHNSGRLYGTTETAGAYDGGTVFELVPPAAEGGGAWTENVLYTFGNGTDGAYPLGNVIFDKAGNLYSTTFVGGSGAASPDCYDRGCGTVFELTPPATDGGNWTEIILHSFPAVGSKTDGSQPTSGLLLWKNSELFGVTPGSGKGSAGTVFAVIP